MIRGILGKSALAAMVVSAWVSVPPSSAGAQDRLDTSTVQASAALPITRAFKVSPLGDLSTPTRSKEHPLTPALRLAIQRLEYIRANVDDYSCLLVKRERINGKLRDYEFATVKCRHNRPAPGGASPFSVYMKFHKPADLKGREVLYVAGQNDDDMLVRKGGRRRAFLSAWIDPGGSLALEDNRYPITDLGIEKLVERLIEVAQHDMKFDECDVRIVPHAKLDGRSCTAIEVTHPHPRDHFQFHVARVMIDDEMQLPVHYSAYTWPESPGGEPQLIEDYTYRNIKINVGFTDDDFHRNHPDYAFRKI
ncbi:MAG: DUF1571 domain-containing protein [Planctomycetales bacterium]|nr:DUF1571 domain-containing protein [Planctomycetales bacterium]